MERTGLCVFCWFDGRERIGQLWGYSEYIDTNDDYVEDELFMCEEHKQEYEED